MPTGTKGWENRLGGGSIALAYAEGPTWDSVHFTVRGYRDAGYDILRIELASDIFAEMQKEANLAKDVCQVCYLEVCGFPVYLNKNMTPGGILVVERTESRA